MRRLALFSSFALLLSNRRTTMKRVLWFGALLALGLGACSDFEPTAPDGTVRPAFDLVVAGLVVNADDDVTDASGCDVTHCSLREAIASADPGATITFAESVTGTITLTATLQINKDLTITGPGAADLSVSGDNLYGVFSFGPGVTASLSGLTIADGLTSTYGGGISNNRGAFPTADGSKYNSLNAGMLYAGLNIPVHSHITVTPKVMFWYNLGGQSTHVLRTASWDGNPNHILGGVSVSTSF